jgi:uncharacterized protein (TIGR04255 family)
VNEIRFGVLSDPRFSDCAPFRELQRLIRAKPTLLPRTIALCGEAPGGCHRIARALLQDLADAGDMRRCAWARVIADCKPVSRPLVPQAGLPEQCHYDGGWVERRRQSGEAHACSAAHAREWVNNASLKCHSGRKWDARRMPQYKRPPITEAVVEVRVADLIPMAAIERVRDRLLEFYPLPAQSIIAANIEIRHDAQHVVHQEVQGFKLTASDGAGVVTIGQQFIGTSRLPPYDGWESFIAAARNNWKIWKRLVEWRKIVRIGVRYINRIDVPANGLVNIDDYLTFSIKGPLLELPPLTSFAINEVRPLGKDDCQLILNAGLVPSPLVKTTSFILDLDISRDVDLPQNDEALWAFIERIRQHKNFVFEGCITNRARELFDR